MNKPMSTNELGIKNKKHKGFDLGTSDGKTIRFRENFKLMATVELLHERIYKALKLIWDNHGLLDKNQIEMLEDILMGEDDE